MTDRKKLPGGLSVSSQAVHQRRRRIAAVAALGLAALAAWAIASMFGGSSTSMSGAAFTDRLAEIGGTGNGSLFQTRRVAEQSAIDATLARTPYIVKGGGEVKEVALTFDDGPSEFTPHYLEILRKEGVGATFFTVGGMYSTFAPNATAAFDGGYSIENHSYTHPQMPTLSVGEQASEVDRTTDRVKGTGGGAPRLFRPPYGAYDGSTLAVAKKRRMLVVLWDVDTMDWSRPGVDSIVNAAVSQAQPGSIILMHDGGGDRTQTLAALPRIIDGLKAKGYRMVSVPRLLTDDPPRAGETPPPSAPA